MKIKDEYLTKYLHDTAISQVADTYKAKGYSITFEQKIGEFEADLVARKDEEVIVIEVKAGKLSPKKKAQISKLSNFIKNQSNYKFLVVFVNPPKEKKLVIENFEELLSNEFKNEIPKELLKLSYNTEFINFSYINIDDVIIQNKQILTKGEGLVNVNLRYDGEKEEGFELNDSFPFVFNISLKYNDQSELEIVNIANLEVDTTSFYQ